MKITYLLTLLLSLIIILTGCRKKSEELVLEEKVILYVDYSVLGDAAFDIKDSEGQIYARFMERNPNIEVLFTKESFQFSFHSTVKQQERIIDNSTDLFFYIPGQRTKSLIDRGVISKLNPYITEGVKSRYSSLAFMPEGAAGEIYSVPTTLTATHVFYINHSLLKKLNMKMPLDFDSLTRMAPSIRKVGLEPIIMANKSNWVMEACLFSTILGRMGGADWPQRFSQGENLFREEYFINSLHLLKEFYNSELLSHDSLELEYNNGPPLFAEARAPFMIDGSWQVDRLVDLMSESEQKSIEMTAIPTLPGQRNNSFSTSVAQGPGLAMRSGLSREKAYAAWKLISYYAGEKEGLIRLKEQGVIPAVKLSKIDWKPAPLVKQHINFYQKIDEALPVVDNAFTGQIYQLIYEGLHDIVTDKVTPEKLAGKLDSTLEEYR